MLSVSTTAFDALGTGEVVEKVTMLNGNYSAEIITFGAALRSFKSPDRFGQHESVVLGYKTLQDYIASSERQGAVMGRFVNRVQGASFYLNGKNYQLDANDGPNCIHGGINGFDRRVWSLKDADIVEDVPTTTLSLFSPNGDQGFPGDLAVEVSYALYSDGSLSISYDAKPTEPTILNMTNHSYFNLKGEGQGQITDHIFQIDADYFLPADEGFIPTGEISPVKGTLFDFRKPTALRHGIRSANEQIMMGRGYDHCFVLADCRRDTPTFAAKVVDPISGRSLTVFTTEPGLQLHSGNVLSGRFAGDAGRTYRQSDGFCLEAQMFPNAPHNPEFPSWEINPSTGYQTQTIYKLGIENDVNAKPKGLN